MGKKIGVTYATLLLCAMGQARPHRPKQSCAREYTVNQGDTCDGISAHQQVSTYQLASLNKHINPTCTNLVVGDVLCLGQDTNDCTTVQVVQQGDICSKIAQQAGITVADLLTNNPNINQGCTNIYVGEVLCVAPVSNSTASSLPGAATALPSSPLSDIGSAGAGDPPGIPLTLNLPPNTSSGITGPSVGQHHSPHSGANSPDSPLGLNIPTDGGQGSPSTPLALNGATNAGPDSNVDSGDNSGLPLPIPLSGGTSPQGTNVTTSSNTLPPLNISSTASGTPFNVTIPEGADSSHGIPSGPSEGINGADIANSGEGPTLGLPGNIEIGDGQNAKKAHGPAGLFPSH